MNPALPTLRRRTLSVNVLTYNEAHRLRPCLESITWADEVVVVDGFSTDDSVAVAREFTPHVYQSDLLGPKNPGGYSAQRNFALDRSTCDWVMYLDADERVTPELRDEIVRRLLEGPDEGHEAYEFRRFEHFFGVQTDTYGTGFYTRIIRGGRGRFDDRSVHEGLKFEGSLGSLEGRIVHLSKDTVEQLVQTNNRYTGLEAIDLMKHKAPLPRHPAWGMVKTFLHRYLYLRGYREGTFGFMMSVHHAYYWFLCWAKYWELRKNRNLEPLVYRPGLLGRCVAAPLSFGWRGVTSLKVWLKGKATKGRRREPGPAPVATDREMMLPQRAAE